MAGLRRSLQSTLERGVRRVRKRLNPYSDYEHTIPPEIKDDDFYQLITSLASAAPVDTILEIGSSNGEGSTGAFVEGIHKNPTRPMLFCMEVSRPRFEQLQQRFASDPQVRCYNLASVPADRLPSDAELVDFYRTRKSKLNRTPLPEVMRWLRQDRQYLGRFGVTRSGIQIIKEQNGIDRFGMVLIDGSEFSGQADLDEVYGANYLLLDDIETFKNLANYERLLADPSYRLVAFNRDLRNGYAAFERCI
jgi:hypothetical protein